MDVTNGQRSNGNVQEDPKSANGSTIAPKMLWRHPAPMSTPMFRFLEDINQSYGLQLSRYDELHKWSTNNVAKFWGKVWSFVGIKAGAQASSVLDERAPMYPRPAFFQGATLNFAENMLYPTQDVDPKSIAIIEATEITRATVTWQELRERVRNCQAGMKALDIKQGDRVAGYVANHTNALVAMLAATSLGAIWTAVSPDTGVHAVLERLRQIEPIVLFADNAAFYNGRSHPVIPKVAEIASALPTLKAVVVFPTVTSIQINISSIELSKGKAYDYQTFTTLQALDTLSFKQLNPDHPVYILYSSGTTGHRAATSAGRRSLNTRDLYTQDAKGMNSVPTAMGPIPQDTRTARQHHTGSQERSSSLPERSSQSLAAQGNKRTDSCTCPYQVRN